VIQPKPASPTHHTSHPVDFEVVYESRDPAPTSWRQQRKPSHHIRPQFWWEWAISSERVLRAVGPGHGISSFSSGNRTPDETEQRQKASEPHQTSTTINPREFSRPACPLDNDRCGYNILTGQPRGEIVDPPPPEPSSALAHWSHHGGGS